MWQIISFLLLIRFSLCLQKFNYNMSQCAILSPFYLKPFRLLDVYIHLSSNLDALAIISPNILSASLSFSSPSKRHIVGHLMVFPNSLRLSSLLFNFFFSCYPIFMLTDVYSDQSNLSLNLASEFLFSAIVFLALELLFNLFLWILSLYWYQWDWYQ